VLGVGQPTSNAIMKNKITDKNKSFLVAARVTMANRRKKHRKSRRSYTYRRPALPTILEQPQEELLAALELQNSPRSKRNRWNHSDVVADDEVAGGEDANQASSSSPSSSSPKSVFCLKFVGKLVDVSNLVSPDLKQQCDNDTSGREQEAMCSSSSFAAEVENDSTTSCEQQRTHALLCDIYPTLRNVEDIAELDVDKVLQDCIVMRNNSKSSRSSDSSNSAVERSSIRTSTNNRYLLQQQQVPPMTTSSRGSPRRSSDWGTTPNFTGFSSSSSSRRSDVYQDEPQIESLRHSASTAATNTNRAHQSLFSFSSSSSSSSSPLPLPARVESIEIGPGCSKTLRGADETTRAVKFGFIEHQDCLSCSVPLVYVADAEYVLCPKCRVISPVLSCFGMSTGSCHAFDVNPCKQRPLNFWGSAAGGVGLGLLAGSLPRVG
jgi:hypothetical protein